MNSRKTVTRILAVGAAVPLMFGTVMVPAHAAEGTAKPAKKYTMAQVKQHNKASNCWTVVGKNVYKVTAWIPKHPGGKGVVVAMCGKNGTTLFNSKHGKDPIAKGSLAKYKIGNI
jgi:cytochrome b involved in lipid metabolism